MGKKVLLVVLCLLALVGAALSMLSLMAGQQSVGIIGGADGPTTVWATGTGSPAALYIVTAVLLIAATVCYLLYRSRHSR